MSREPERHPGPADPLRELWRDVLQAAFRLFPWPTEPGLRRVGAPGAFSPVIVTGNYDLTVRRLMRALQGLDAWVVVAPSSGINVWCAASGGLLTTVGCDAEGAPAYAVEGSIFIAGAAIQWLRDGLGLIERAGETEAMACPPEISPGRILGREGVERSPRTDPLQE